MAANKETNLSLDHVAAPLSHAPHKPKDVDVPLCGNPLQLRIEGDERTSPPNACAAVDQQGPLLLVGLLRHHLVDKMEKGGWVFRHTVVGPHGEVELPHDPLHLAPLLLQGEGADGVICQDQGLLGDYCKALLSEVGLTFLWPVLVTFDLHV